MFFNTNVSSDIINDTLLYNNLVQLMPEYLAKFWYPRKNKIIIIFLRNGVIEGLYRNI